MPRSRHTSLEKLKIITEYQHQDKPLATFARTKQIVPKTLIRWISLYKRDGIDGLKEA
ncbi:transposase, partial [Pediococcus argentinicus]|nr:transposase [Pediococcus argentinicus]NKZ22213.1 transposase [Pediococcus argentinicus]